MSGLRIRQDVARYMRSGAGRSGRMSRGGMMNRGGGGAPVGVGGLGDDPETILNTPDPVGMYVTALQKLIYHGSEKEEFITGRWDPATHQALLAWLGGIYGVEDLSRFPAWGQDPGFTAYFVVEILFGGFDMDRAFDALTVFFSALGLPTTSMAEAMGVLTQRENAERMRVVLDRVVRYIIGAEGGQVYGSKPVQYEGIAAGVAAVVGSVSAILLVG